MSFNDLDFGIFAGNDRISQIDDKIEELKQARLSGVSESRSKEILSIIDQLQKEKTSLQSQTLTLERFKQSQNVHDVDMLAAEAPKDNTLRNILLLGGALLLLG